MPGQIKFIDRVRDETTTTGTGNVTLAGTPPTTYIEFDPVFTVDVDSFYYCIVHSSADEWEVGIGYLSGTTTLVRETVTHSTNSNALVNFSAGTKEVFCTNSAYGIGRRPTLGRGMLLSKGNFLP